MSHQPSSYAAEPVSEQLSDQFSEKEFISVLQRVAANVFSKIPYNIQTGLTPDDLVNEGYLGAKEEAEQWDPNHGVSFRGYIWPRARGAMIDYLRKSNFVPRGIVSRGQDFKREISRLSHRLGHSPSYDEAALGLGQERLATIEEGAELVRKARARLRKSNGKDLSCRTDLETEIQNNPDEEIGGVRAIEAVRESNYLIQIKRKLKAKLGTQPNQTQLAKQVGEDYLDSPDSSRVGSKMLLILDKEGDSKNDLEYESPNCLKDWIPNPEAEDPSEVQPQQDTFLTLTKGLNQNETQIIWLYYWEEKTMKEIGAELDLTESRVSQMHSALRERLQQTHPKSRLAELGVMR